MDKLPSFQKIFVGLMAVLGLILAARLLFAPEKMPHLDYRLIDGTVLSAQNLQGKVVVVSFWSTTCGPCIAEMPHLAKMHEAYHGQGLEIVAVALPQDAISSVVRMADQKNLPFKVAYDANRLAVQAWGGIRYTPTVFIVNRQGQVVQRIVGQSSEEIEARVKTLL